MKEEVLKKESCKKNPFRVPAGYFENFSDRIMQQLPAGEENNADAAPQTAQVKESAATRVNLFERVKPYLYLAAMFAGLYFGIYVFKNQVTWQQEAKAPVEDMTVVYSSDEYLDEVFNFAMVDNEVIYDYLSEEY